uniref:Cytochrome P450 18a1 (inferred by orthology to a D. melanogaster protein) n=1 Tax=Strongyloides venezuelensis TaxID=75913 RepID=A0A0K0EZ51_STRVS
MLLNYGRKVKSLPPGPLPLPIVGNLLFFDFKKTHLWIYNQKKVYGNVFTIWIPTPHIVFADYDSINEALVTNDDNFLGRNVNGYPEKLFSDKPNVGVVFSEGEEWRDQRRLSLHILRNFGMSRTIMQDKIHLVVQDFYEYVDSLKDKDNVKSLPPGPLPLPILGNLLSFDFKKTHLWIYNQKKVYGNVFTIWIPTPHIVFADYDSINEALVTNDDNFLGRNVNGYPEKLFSDKPNVGVVFSEGEEWRDQRRLSLHILRNFGMSRTIMQDKIHLVVQDFYEYVDSLKDKDNVDIEKILQLSVGNVINLILFGFMYSHTDNDEYFELIEAHENLIKLAGSWEIKLLSLIPFIDKISFLRNFLCRRVMGFLNKVKEMTNYQIEECKKSYNPDDEPPNFIHAVMKEIQSVDSKYSYLNSDHLVAIVFNFWLAGRETTATTLKWFVLFIMKHLDIQKKLQDEIDNVIGKDRLQKVNATLIIGFAPSHRCTKDTVVNGHLIPNNTIIQPFYWGANMDEKYFKDPFTFNPNRFIDSEGNFKVEHEHMSFVKGKRIYAGKSLADAELFLIFTSLLQKYKFIHPYGPIYILSDSHLGIPISYKCKIGKR